MNRDVFSKKTFNSLQKKKDRFVFSRERVISYRDKYKGSNIPPIQIIKDLWTADNVQKKNYINYLKEVLEIDKDGVDTDKRERHDISWPCIPRKSSYIKPADTVLDLPGYRNATFPHLLDWGKNDLLLAALGKTYYTWSWRLQNASKFRGIANNLVTTCKFSPKENIVLLGTAAGSIEPHQPGKGKLYRVNYCRCIFKDRVPCQITALDWSPTGKSFASGCSRGYLTSWTSKLEVLSRVKLERRVSILKVRISPDTRYVASQTEKSNIVLIWSWYSLEPYFKMFTEGIVNTIAWHPWRSALLGIGLTYNHTNGQLVLWEAASACVKRAEVSGVFPYSIDDMLFSHRTGELLLNCKVNDTWWDWRDRLYIQQTGSRLIVLSDEYNIVDTVIDQTTNEIVNCIMFSPDGTKVAAATADEDLIIWHFAPDKPENKKRKDFSAIPVYLDNAVGVSCR